MVSKIVEPVDDNTIDHAFSTLGRDSKNREILQRSANKMERLKELDQAEEGEK